MKNEQTLAEPEAHGTLISDEILTDKQVAEELGVPLQTLRFWWAQGRGMRAFKAGRYKRVLRSELIKWCRQKCS